MKTTVSFQKQILKAFKDYLSEGAGILTAIMYKEALDADNIFVKDNTVTVRVSHNYHEIVFPDGF